jgi:hypothetical protein
MTDYQIRILKLNEHLTPEETAETAAKMLNEATGDANTADIFINMLDDDIADEIALAFTELSRDLEASDEQDD